MDKQRGFTLIELVIVIIILGVLAAIAIPKFVDITAEAHTSAARGVAGALSSGSAINYATRTANAIKGVPISVANVCTSTVAQTLLTGTTTTLTSAAPTTNDQFQISGTGDCTAATANTSVQCTVTPMGSGVSPATATLVCVQ